MKKLFCFNAITAISAVFFNLSVSFAGDRVPDNPVLKLDSQHEDGEKWVVKISEPISVYRSPAAQRVRAVLLQNQTIDVLEMNRFGLRIRGRAANGFVDGWAGWKQVVGDDKEKLEMLETLRERLLEVMPLLEEKKPAIGMTLTELKRVLGPPTRIQTQATGGKKTQTLHWIRKEMVNTDDVLGQLAVLTKKRELEVDAGSVSAVLVNGVANTVEMNLTDGDNEVAMISPPGKLPFETVADPNAKSRDKLAKRTR